MIEVDGGPDRGPILALPEDESWIGLLGTKRDQYLAWIADKHKYHAPELRNSTRQGYAIRLIEELDAQRSIYTWDLCRAIFEEQGRAHFNMNNFNAACATVELFVADREALEKSIFDFETALKNGK